MKQNRDNIEDIFASRLKDFEMDVPDAVWGQLSQKLQTKKVAVPPKRLSNKKVLWWSLSAVASLLLLLFALRQEGGGDAPIDTLREKTKNIAKETIGEAESTRNLTKSGPLASLPRRNQRKLLTSGSISLNSSPQEMKDEILPKEIGASEEVGVENASAEQADRSIGKRNDTELERKTEEFSNAAKDAASKLFADADVKVSSEKPSHSFGVTAAGGLGLSSQTKTANQLLSLNASTESVSALKSSDFPAVQGMRSSSNSSYQLDHSWPVSFSIGVTTPLASFLDLEIGISYSYLYSKQKGESNASMKQSQQFSYIGLPVALNFRVARWDRFRLGVLAGGSLQKDIAGRLKQEIKASSSYEDYSTNSIHQKYIQPSLNANLHLSYSLGKNFSLFGKMGGAYYFDMNDNYNTIYSDKNFLPDVGFGLSYNLKY